MNYFFTADEHYNHTNILRYCDRPFSSIAEMNEELISRHNAVVGKNDYIIHAGDFFLGDKNDIAIIIKSLKGNHIFLKGSHDRWLQNAEQIWSKVIAGQKIVVSHYCLRTWDASHYNSWHLFGHSHGKLEPLGKSWDIGVDNNNFYPLSFDEIAVIMKNRPDNFNLIKK